MFGTLIIIAAVVGVLATLTVVVIKHQNKRAIEAVSALQEQRSNVASQSDDPSPQE